MKPSLIVHGGAWDIPDEAVDVCKAGCRRALSAGWSILTSGGSALDALEAAIIVLEDDPVFDAGFGSHLNMDGQVECDVIVMDGATLKAGSIAGVKRIRNPIRLARKVMENCPCMMLISEGAERFAQEQGIALCAPEELISPIERKAWALCKKNGAHNPENHHGYAQGTVGAVAMDRNGAIFAATSTGGVCCKLPGRVGDSPLIGSGCYADVKAGGVSSTGYGEAIMKIIMAKTATDLLHSRLEARAVVPAGAPSHASQVAQECINLLSKRTNGTGGIILLDRDGNPGFAFNTPRMARGYVANDGTFVTGV